ncbi:hypothetical protein B0H11DRAFT_2259319 [Mycena galericulata]|nr:hypothetical protein B0H11DRAFT_2259319 [Mycena galericulata]
MGVCDGARFTTHRLGRKHLRDLSTRKIRIRGGDNPAPPLAPTLPHLRVLSAYVPRLPLPKGMSTSTHTSLAFSRRRCRAAASSLPSSSASPRNPVSNWSADAPAGVIPARTRTVVGNSALDSCVSSLRVRAVANPYGCGCICIPGRKLGSLRACGRRRARDHPAPCTQHSSS